MTGPAGTALALRTGELFRHRDPSGISGIGVVAQLCVFDNGDVAVAWLGKHPSTAIWRSVDDVLAVHGHHGATVIYWSDGEVQERPGEDEACDNGQ